MRSTVTNTLKHFHYNLINIFSRTKYFFCIIAVYSIINNFVSKPAFGFLDIILAHLINAQNVGIGTTASKARLHVTDSSIVFSARGIALIKAGFPPIRVACMRLMRLIFLY